MTKSKSMPSDTREKPSSLQPQIREFIQQVYMDISTNKSFGDFSIYAKISSAAKVREE